MAKDTAAPAAPKPADPPAKRRHPDYWRAQLGVGEPEHVAAVVTGGWDVHRLVTEAEYRAALKRYREGAA